MEFTREQKKVIRLRNKNILVSAAAGSGKTAVLVERILGLILDEKNPVDIDRLLIVTFTNAAADEMRERIGKAIEDSLMKQPDNVHLQRQSTLLHRALITTIDSFCLFIIRNNFNEIGLDPGFRVADSGEIKLLKQDIINEVFEQCLEDEKYKARFVNMLENLAARGKEKILEEAILKIYDFAQSFPWPREWLSERYDDYYVEAELEDTSWGQILREDVGNQLEQMESRLQSAIEMCMEPGGPYMYEEALASDLDTVALLRRMSWQEQYEYMQNLKFATLSRKKDDGVLPEKREQIKEFRDEIKGELKKIAERFYGFSKETIKKQMAETMEVEKTLIDTVMLFGEKFETRKREKNILDFHDMEHFALNILVQREMDEETGKLTWKPTKTALDYTGYFKEIMIDEYQDSNLVQELLLQSISGEREGRPNRFMVGDLKQSIYKFRLARPEIFLEKYHEYPETEDEDSQRVDLHQNFRSRKEVLDSVNHVFYQIMGKELGKIEYTSKEALNCGAAYEECEEDYQTELLLLENKEEEPRKAEALMVAGRIRQLVGKFLITDPDTRKLRPAGYGDIVVLLRTNAGWAEDFYNVFMEQQIPVCVTGKTGYFSASEVQIVLSFLKVIDNPRQDIPLYGTMKSRFGRFTEEEIVKMKGMGQSTLYDNLKAMKEGELGEKAAGFLKDLKRYRDLVYIMPIHKLLRLYLEETGYLYYFAGLAGGKQRVANVRMLLEKAEDYEKTSYFGLFHFIRYMEQLQKYDIETEEAETEDESGNAVRIMSIHKSKGLEFPICIVAGLSKKMNMQDADAALICDMDMGIGMEYRNPVTRVKNPDLRRDVLGRKMKMDNLGEELRVLYVAMTRAKEKLILAGVVEEYEKRMLSYFEVSKSREMKLPTGMLQRSKSFMDFLLPAVIRNNECIKIHLWNPWIADKEKETDVIYNEIERIELEERMKRPLSLTEQEIVNRLQDKINFVYKHEDLQGLYAKTSVSELKMKAMEEADGATYQLFEEAEIVPYIPRFIEKREEVNGTARGNAYHRVMELLDFIHTHDSHEIRKSLEQKAKDGLIEENSLQLIRWKKIESFWESDLGRRMQEAAKYGKLFREQPFVLGISAKRVQDKFPSDEKVLIQGIVDAYFEEENEIVVVDYKTDTVNESEELIRRYREQLNYYGEALEQLTGKKLKEKLIYSFALNETIKVEK